MVFFDSAKEMEAGSKLSVLSVEPMRWLVGNLFEDAGFVLLQTAVSEASKGCPKCDDGLPGTIVAGAVEYNGDFCFGVYDKVLVFRHQESVWYGSGDWWRPLVSREVIPARLNGHLKFEATLTAEMFCERVRVAQDYIRAGDIYQVNLSHQLKAAWPGGDPWAFYEALRHYTPAPFSAYLSQPKRAVLSSSPELFLKFSGRSIQTRPIKGTRPRRADMHADERNAFDLITSPKEISELVMITDLERNDLGQFCEWGSVEVSELLKLERHEQVFHLVSTVQGRMRTKVDPVTALRCCFPGGSITGAPKRRAKEVISELEDIDRGLYTGAAGWFGSSGESVFNILIRTVIVDESSAHFHVGAGVVADSSPIAEWQETWDKAAGILLAAERVQAVSPAAPPQNVACEGYLEPRA
jgi:anthranilate/para-aminobenzoate synthase component I